MMRSKRWLAACLSLSLTACGPEGTEAPQAPRSEERASRTADVEAALRALPGSEVTGAHEDGVPYMIRGALGETGRGVSGASARQVNALLLPALERVAPVFRLRARDLMPLRVSRDEQGHTHLRYAQTKNGLPVVGEQLILHLDEQGRLYAVNGSARDGEGVSAQPRISADAARQAALGSTPGGTSAGEPRLVYVRAPATGLLTLVFQVAVEGRDGDSPVSDQVFVDALGGAEVWRYSNLHLARNRRVCSVGGTNSGTCRIEGQAPTSDPVINAAYDNLGRFWDCFNANYARDSYNNAGALLSARVHYQTHYSNAFWDGTNLVCGDGDGVNAGPLCSDPDVVIHELTHGVTDSESALIYSNESGALSESLSDIFAAVCQSWASGTWTVDGFTWQIGEVFYTPSTPWDALRYMDNPTLDGSSRDYYPERYTGTSGSGGVHMNSGIVNLAFALLSTGGTHPRGRTTIVVPGVGIQAAGRIFYKANTDFFTSSTTMAQAKTYTRQAAVVLGYGTAIQDAVDKAWEAVGVGVAAPPPSCTAMTNGVTLTGLSGAAGSEQYFCLDTPANVPVTFTLSGGAGDADMYVKFGSAPTTASFDCRPYRTGNSETCSLAARTTAGRYWVMLRGYAAYSGVSLRGQY